MLMCFAHCADLELLAQSDGPRGKSCHQDAPSVNTGSAVSGKSWGFQDDNNSSGRVSRFFDCEYLFSFLFLCLIRPIAQRLWAWLTDDRQVSKYACSRPCIQFY